MSDATADLMSKGDFARFVGVSAGRVSQYIAEGKISGAAIEGDGRFARIRASVAADQLKRSLEPSQRFGLNGVAGKGAAPAAPIAQATDQPKPEWRSLDPVQEELADLRLVRERIKTREAEREEALTIGRYMLTEDVRRAMGRLASSAFKIMDAGLNDLAAAIAEAFAVPQHEAHRVLQKAFRDVRASASERLRAETERHERLVAAPEEDEDQAA